MQFRATIPLILCALSASTLCAEVSFVRDLSSLGYMDILLPQTKAPIDTSDPLYDPDLPDRQWITTIDKLHLFDPTGFVYDLKFLPTPTRVNPTSRTAMAGVNTTEPILYVWGARAVLHTIRLNIAEPGDPIVTSFFPVAMGFVHSMAAADRTNLTMLGTGDGHIVGLYSVDVNDGSLVRSITFTPGTAPGEFSLETYYHTYAPNGLVYLLDYGNSRMQAFDPADDFSFVSEFAFESSVLTANMQFAIGPTGKLYLGDGLGGGSYYSATGDFLGTFSLDTPFDPTLDIGVPYLSTDSFGHIYVFDNTGFHQYLDTAVVPEPASFAWLLGAGALFFTYIRRRRT
jgi:hypothetical protein